MKIQSIWAQNQWFLIKFAEKTSLNQDIAFPENWQKLDYFKSFI